MARDIEEFLRRAAERRQQQKAGGQPQPQQPPPQQPPVRDKPIRQLKKQPLEEVEVEIIEPEIVQPPQQKRKKPLTNLRRESVSEHVNKHMDNRSIGQHAEQLGDRIASVHDRVDKRIHQRLDHDINRIDDLPTVTDDARPGIVGSDTSALAGSLHKLLASPESVRQAILISEVLKRPDFD